MSPAPTVYGPASPATGWVSSEYFRVVIEKMWLIVLVAVAGFFVTFGYLAHEKPVYLAAGSLQVQPPPSAPRSATLTGDEPNLSTIEALNTLVQNLGRPSFLLEVANDPSLQADLFLFPAKGEGTPYTDQEKIGKIAAAVHVALQKGTLLIVVSARHTQPATAKRICDAMLNNFVKDRMESRTDSEQETYRFLLNEAERLGQALADEERAIEKYDQLARFNDQILQQKAQIAELAQRYKEMYPAMVEARALLSSLQGAFDAEMMRIMKADQAAGMQPVVTIDPTVGVTEDIRARMMGQYQVLRRGIETKRALFQALTAQKNQSDVMRSAQAETAVKIEDHPVLPEVPVSQNAVRTLFAGTFFGALLGLGLAFLLNGMDRSLRTVDQAETLLDLPVLSAVPELVHKRGKKEAALGDEEMAKQDLPILSDPNSPSAESIRSLRASMSLLGSEDERYSTIFTSALPGEGKSFTAANYAIALACQNSRTLLVDADLRRPTLHAVFNLPRGDKGLVNYLLSREPLENFVVRGETPLLDILLCGTRAPNPSELLAGRGFARLIEEARGKYDHIVVDTAPVNAVSDTLMLINHVQSVCLVVRAASSPREAVARAVKVLEKSGRRPVGIVFNRVPRRAELGYHRNYYYHYGTAERYGDAYGAATP